MNESSCDGVNANVAITDQVDDMEFGDSLIDALRVELALYNHERQQQPVTSDVTTAVCEMILFGDEEDVELLSSGCYQQVGSTFVSVSPHSGRVWHALEMPLKLLQVSPPTASSVTPTTQQLCSSTSRSTSVDKSQPVKAVTSLFVPLAGPFTPPPNASEELIDALIAESQTKSLQCIRIFQSKAQQASIHLDDRLRKDFQRRLQSATSGETLSLKTKDVLHRTQQRLLCLRHALWCREAKGTCSVIPNCQEMQKLWLHMGNCPASRSCSYSHCISSKYVLSHFHECTNPKCPLCPLVRFPMEVKETTGQLMMDMDRAIEQLVLATHKRPIVPK